MKSMLLTKFLKLQCLHVSNSNEASFIFRIGIMTAEAIIKYIIDTESL